MAENITYTALVMDRDLSLGNSEDAYGRRALHVKATNKITEPIPVTIVDGEPGDPRFFESTSVTDPGNAKSILSGVFATGIALSTMVVVCRQESEIILSIGSNVVASGRTGAAAPSASFIWNPRRPVASGSSFDITIKARAGSPISNCEAYLMGLTIT